MATLGDYMKRILLLPFVLFLSQQALAEGLFGLNCKSSFDSFSTIIDTQSKTVEFTERRYFDIAVDSGVYPAEVSKSGSLVYANISTYDYFTGSVKFYLGKGLFKMKHNQRIRIALDADDGDGYGFDKRSYSCLVVKG